MYTIRKEFHFSASHQLKGLPDEHPCSRVHGHNYVVTLELASIDDVLTPEGFVVDYRKLEPFKKLIDERFDHRHLNDFFLGNPTAENIAKHLFDVCQHAPFMTEGIWLKAVEVKETEKTSARYEC